MPDEDQPDKRRLPVRRSTQPGRLQRVERATIRALPGSSEAGVGLTGATAVGAAIGTGTGFPPALIVFLVVLTAVFGRLTLAKFREERESESARLLREHYQRGVALRQHFALHGSPERPDAPKDPLTRMKQDAIQWALDGWYLLVRHFPEYEQAYFGPHFRALGKIGFFSAGVDEIQDLGSVDAYFDAKLSFLAAVLRGVDPPESGGVVHRGALKTPDEH